MKRAGRAYVPPCLLGWEGDLTDSSRWTRLRSECEGTRSILRSSKLQGGGTGPVWSMLLLAFAAVTYFPTRVS